MKMPPVSLILFVVILGVMLQLAVRLMVSDQSDRPLGFVLLAAAQFFPAVYGVTVGFRRGFIAGRNTPASTKAIDR